MTMTIEQIIQENRQAGYHFFDQDTKRFFRSYVYYPVYGDRFFITRETDPTANTAYTIRNFNNDTGKISTVGNFMGHATYHEAVAMVRKLVADL